MTPGVCCTGSKNDDPDAESHLRSLLTRAGCPNSPHPGRRFCTNGPRGWDRHLPSRLLLYVSAVSAGDSRAHRGLPSILLVFCLVASACVLWPRPFAHLEIDPTKYAMIALREDVEVTATVIQTERAAAPRARVYVLAYVEQENRKGFMPATEADYANLFLVRPAERSGTTGPSGRGRYLVVDLWHYYPTRGLKTCHQWTIWEDDPTDAQTRATLQFLVEDANNVVLEARNVPLDPLTVDRLGAFYRRIQGVFAQRVRGLPIPLTWGCGRPGAACGTQTSPAYLARQE